MNQGGKNAAGEPPRPDTKRERRRGAAGRAAALRRAPSDSDCSGETASLSADSGERAPRPVPRQPTRSGKSRSRRRGSEWEVLEGLKDGQRFEKRPDVFNGYLHKKRKWPLKGWHKRFFVVDGGILVYARSPTDVARGRLHGSVDVGLSVISAKARRRRIDIDADEFIYHLRAKTPEVFRTWLNVLKAHRLYRQHLLTFGARESVPKLHPPEENPPTDNSSHTSFPSDSSENLDHPNPLTSYPVPKTPLEFQTSEYNNKDQSTIFKWQQDAASMNSLVSLNFDTLEQTPNLLEVNRENMLNLKFDRNYYCNSLGSMKSIAKRFFKDLDENQSQICNYITDAEKQINSTDLYDNDAKINKINIPRHENTVNLREWFSKLNHANNKPADSDQISNHENYSRQKQQPEAKLSTFGVRTKKPTLACYFFTRKKTNAEISAMKKSKKCTNLVKYKNMSDEPPLKAQTSKCMLLGNKKRVTGVGDKFSPIKRNPEVNKVRGDNEVKLKTVACNEKDVSQESNEVQVTAAKENKSSQKVTAPDDYDKITEQLLLKLFSKSSTAKDTDVKFYIEQVVQDLYDFKFDRDMHPVKALFRNLLEYWLKNTSVSQFKEAMTTDKYVYQSVNHMTKDADVSSFLINMKSKETQLRQMSKHKRYSKINSAGVTHTSTAKQKVNYKNESKCHSPLPTNHSPRRDTASFEKERRIQELERLLKSTVYMCEMGSNYVHDHKKDIEITKKLIDSIGLISKSVNKTDSCDKPVTEKSNSSAEVPELQETINHLISETAIPPDIAKEFLGAYLDVLLQESSKTTNTSESSDWNRSSKESVKCEVIGEAIVKKVSKSVTTLEVNEELKRGTERPSAEMEMEKQIDPGQIYLKDILEKVTKIFSKVANTENNTLLQNKQKDESNIQEPVQKTIKDELGRPVIKSKYDLIYENCNQNSLVIDLSKYNLEHISMFNDPTIKDMMSITIKLKEKPPENITENPTSSIFPIPKFPDDTKTDNWIPYTHDVSTNDVLYKPIPNKLSKIETKEHKAEKRNLSIISDRASKTQRYSREDCDCDSSDCPIVKTKFSKNKDTKKTGNEELQPCYVMSIKKGTLASKFQAKKNNDDNSSKLYEGLNKIDPVEKQIELTVFEKPAPKIIDEKFIMLLLENLSYISRNVASMHKDINTLYMQFKKKFDKLVKAPNNIQGLSLLGKIYSEDTNTNVKDKGVQCVLLEGTDNKPDVKHVIINTSIVKIGERSACTYTHTPLVTNVAVQTDHLNIFHAKVPSTDDVSTFETIPSVKPKTVVTETNTTDIHMAEQATSKPNWTKATTKETEMNTIIRYIFKESGPKTLKHTTLMTLKKDLIKNKKASSKLREELVKEMSLLKPLLKVSMHSQTEKQLLLTLDKKEKDYIHQLFSRNQCGMKTSSSVCTSVDVELSDEIRTQYRCSSDPSNCSGVLSPSTPTIRGPQAGFVSGTPGGRFQGWILESGGGLENCTRSLGQAQLSVQQLQRLLEALDAHHQHHHDTDVSLDGASPNVKKERRKFALRKKKSSTKCASVELQPPYIDTSNSHTALSSLSAFTAPPSPGGGACSVPNSAASLPIACAAARPQSLPGADTLNTAQGPSSITSLTPDHQLREDFTVLAKDLVASLKGIVSSLVVERNRARAALEAGEVGASPAGGVVAALRTNLTSALHQNSELRSRLSRIHDASDIAEIISLANSDNLTRQFQQSLSYSSSCVSASEFFDAEEHDDDDLKPDDVLPADEAGVIELDGDSTSEAGSLSSEEGSASSDNSDGAMLSAEQVTLRHSGNSPRPPTCWTRRTRLPAPRPSPGGPSLWNLLYKNIGKDLSQISMPVTINEPLNMLQRLCEELEYSELLDSAAACGNAIERAALVAAFAVSAYAASAHRAASKPFNPLLAETYECVREDKGFRFLAEQVSHHPPISACHAESPRWCFWQEARIKTKFWGKSMEFQPTGRVHVRLHTTGDHYTWNKVTTCVHNLFGGQRWVDQYGDMHIVCVGTDIAAKLNFVKASSWSATRHEVRGAVSGGGARLRLAGRWSEAFYAGEPPAARCLWRPGAMPPEHELYYGFTRFAMELNEIEPGMRELLPHTDTRLRPDQRALEEGDVDAAESYKHQLEQAQRERRRDTVTHQPAWFRKTIEDGEETWVFSGEYWKAREAGFSDDVAPRIW